MLIKSITLNRFLPYKEEQTIEFSIDKEKNVTLIMGNNGSGKTSLSQAFEWCLYGIFPEGTNSVLNRYVRDHLSPGTFSYVIVSINIQKYGIDYTIERKQKYSRKENGELNKPGVLEFLIEYRDGAETKQVPLSQQKETIDKLLSEELSHYFFFDGEHIKKMRDEIKRGKSTDFANAVKSILGLQHIYSALEHLKSPHPKSSVERWFKNQIDSAGNQNMQTLQSSIDSLETRNDKLRENAELAKYDESAADQLVEQYKKLLEENVSSENAIKAVEKAKDDLSIANFSHDRAINNFFDIFRSKQYRFISDSLIQQALTELVEEDKISKGIPSVNDKTINFLLERKECLCGTKFNTGDEIFQNLTNLLNYVPPKDLGTYISEFEHECKVRTEESNDCLTKESTAFREFGNSELSIETAVQALNVAQTALDSLNHVDVKILRDNMKDAEQEKRNAIERGAIANREIASNNTKIKNYNDEIRALAVGNEKNMEIEKCLTYVDYIYDFLKNYYDNKEIETRNDLQEVVDKFFTTIYDGELHLELDENYGVTVTVEGLKRTNEEWRTSSGQALSIVLAFICGVLELAKRNVEQGDELLQGDTYPLVMDAPLSDFDKERIGTICSVLPDVAEQVIIIIKDLDGELAEQHLQNRIGKRYFIEKISDYESVIREVNNA